MCGPGSSKCSLVSMPSLRQQLRRPPFGKDHVLEASARIARCFCESGLNERDYIVPGAGGLGEILNNSYV